MPIVQRVENWYAENLNHLKSQWQTISIRSYESTDPVLGKVKIGRKVFRPDLRRKGLHPTFPMGRYLGQSLSVKCETIRDVRRFLSNCRGVSDKEQFGKDEYWQPDFNN